MFVGLLCKQTKYGRFVEFILNRMKLDPNDVNYFKFRGDGWPGFVEAHTVSGQIKTHPFLDRAIVSSPWRTYCFSPLGCMTCKDATAEYADITTGDAWLPDFAGDEKGLSLFVSRSHRGEKLIKDAVQDGIISANPISPERVVESHWPKDLELKKRNRLARIVVFKKFCDPDIPLQYFNISKIPLIEYIDALWIYLIRNFFSSRFITRYTSRAPIIIHKILAKIPISLNKSFLFYDQKKSNKGV